MGQSAGYVHISVRNAQRRADGMSRRGQARAGLRLAGGTDAPDSQTALTPVLAPNGIPGPQAVARENGADAVECAVVAPENTTVDVTATIALPPPLSPLGPARGVSRAGPPPGEP